MDVRYWRMLVTVIALASLAVSFLVCAALYPNLPGDIPAHIDMNGRAGGAVPAFTIFVPSVILAVAFAVMLSRQGHDARYRGDATLLTIWFSLAAAALLVLRIQVDQANAALHPGVLHPITWIEWSLMCAVLVGATANVFFGRFSGGTS